MNLASLCRSSLTAVGLALLGGCRNFHNDWPNQRIDQPPPGMAVQGFIGLSEVTPGDFGLNDGTGATQDTGDATMPAIGGVFQYPLAGADLRLGVEGGFTLGWQGDFDATIINNGTIVVLLDNELVLWDLFVGMFADLFVADHLRFYVGAGPLMQIGSISTDYDDPVLGPQTINDDGFGGGVYARGGFEFELTPGVYVGLGYRFIDSALDFSAPLNDLDLRSEQIFFTVTQCY